MGQPLIYTCAATKAAIYAANRLPFPLIDHPAPEVTHLLLDVPSFQGDGLLRNGTSIEKILERLPETVRVIGGRLTHPVLDSYPRIDLLEDPMYLAQNAQITARCALRKAISYLDCTLLHCPVLVVGWGRIGKCLGKLLRDLGAEVTVAARKPQDRAMLEALGYPAADPCALDGILSRMRLIFNTVPATVLTQEMCRSLPQNSVKIDLASVPGIEADAIHARGLPGLLAPESAGILIAQTITRLLKEEGV